MSASTEFKVGDRVRIKSIKGYAALAAANPELAALTGIVIGNTGTITRLPTATRIGYKVRTDNAKYPTDSELQGWTFYADELELIRE